MSTDAKSPGFWFYTADYERDMQILSLAAQGLWTRMLCWMHENEAHRGFLELPTGAPMSAWDIGAKVGKPIREIERCVTEMERVGIFSRDTRGCIYSRRMARENHISTVRRNAANSRHERAKRAADGTFAGDFAGAKPSSKTMQNPPVSDSVSDSDSASTVREHTSSSVPLCSQPPAPSLRLCITDVPKTEAAVRKRFSTADPPFVVHVANQAVQAWLCEQQQKIPMPDDADIADAVRQALADTDHRGPGLLLTTVPTVIQTWCQYGRQPPTITPGAERIVSNLRRMHARA